MIVPDSNMYAYSVVHTYGNHGTVKPAYELGCFVLLYSIVW